MVRAQIFGLRDDLVADKNCDPGGLDLTDEFSDNIAAYIEPFHGNIELVSIETLP